LVIHPFYGAPDQKRSNADHPDCGPPRREAILFVRVVGLGFDD